MHMIHRNKNGRHPAETETHGQIYENIDISLHPGSEVTNTNTFDAQMHARITAGNNFFLLLCAVRLYGIRTANTLLKANQEEDEKENYKGE